MTNDSLEISTFVDTDECKLVIRGWIDEDSKFPQLDLSKNLRLDLDGVTHINSIGLRKFHAWLVQMKPSHRIVFERCPVTVVSLFGNLTIFQSLNIEVASFYVPYFSPSNNEEKNVLFRSTHEFDAKGNLHPPKVFDSQNNEMQMDADEGTYFRFMRAVSKK